MLGHICKDMFETLFYEETKTIGANICYGINPMVLHIHDGDDYVEIAVNYCPMCGKKSEAEHKTLWQKSQPKECKAGLDEQTS